MSALNRQPTNLNYLSPLGFKFSLLRAPNFCHFIQSINVPTINLGSFTVSTPFIRLPLPGDQLQFGELNLTFRVNEDMRSYTDIYDWLIFLGYPDNFEQFKNVAPATDDQAVEDTPGPYSDGTLTILSTSMNPITNIIFYDMYPVALSDLTFDTKSTDVEYIECSATFAYKRYELQRL